MHSYMYLALLETNLDVSCDISDHPASVQ